MARNCKVSGKEQESRGNTGHKKDSGKGSTRQVTTELSNDLSDTSDGNTVDPLSLLYSDFDGTVDTVSVSVPTSGVIDTGADITIMGGGLFKRVTATASLERDSRSQTVSHTPMTESSLNSMEGWI